MTPKTHKDNKRPSARDLTSSKNETEPLLPTDQGEAKDVELVPKSNATFAASGKLAKPVIERLPIETQTLYSELLEHLRVADFLRSFSALSGNFLLRERGEGQYWYFRTSEGPESRPSEFYIGLDNDATRLLIETYKEGRTAVIDSESRSVRLTSMLRSGGLAMTDAASAKIIKGFGAAGVFKLGGVLIGTHAFVAIGNSLGVKWPSSVSTQDVDFSAPRQIDFGIPQTPQLLADLPTTVESLAMGFIPHIHTHKDVKPTSFVVLGKDWRIDLLTTPQGADRETPVFIPRFKTHAQPLAFMEYCLGKTMNAIIVNGGSTLVRVPEPARFAIHKLLVASNRAKESFSKIEKDRLQAYLVLSFLQEERPGDITIAAEDACNQGSSWLRRIREQASRLPRVIPELQDVLDKAKH